MVCSVTANASELPSVRKMFWTANPALIKSVTNFKPSATNSPDFFRFLRKARLRINFS